MKDILLDNSGDLFINQDADIELTDSVVQAVNIRLKWFLSECALYADDIGTDYYGVIFVKNPDLQLAATEIRSQIMLVKEITEVVSVDIQVDEKTRIATIVWEAKVQKETYRGEVDICQTMA